MAQLVAIDESFYAAVASAEPPGLVVLALRGAEDCPPVEALAGEVDGLWSSQSHELCRVSVVSVGMCTDYLWATRRVAILDPGGRQMGARGPVPKRSSERRRRNKESKPDTVKPRKPKAAPKGKQAEPDVFAPRPAKKTWHPIAREWYESLPDSGQTVFYEPSDWTAAFYVAEVMSRHLQAKRMSAQLFASVWAAMAELLTTEGARRRARIEVERDQEPEQSAGVTALDDYRKRASS